MFKGSFVGIICRKCFDLGGICSKFLHLAPLAINSQSPEAGLGLNFVLMKKILFKLLLKEIIGTSFLISISKQISIKMKNPESLRYHYVCNQLFYFIIIIIFFTYINEEYFNSSYYKVYHPSLCKISFHLL